MEEVKYSTILDVSTDQELNEMISITEICRLCANQNDKLIGIFSEDGLNNELANKMNLYLPVKVCETDDLPLQCCWQCASTVLAWHELVVTSVEADRRLRSYQFVSNKQLEDVTESIKNELPKTTLKEECDTKEHNVFTDNDIYLEKSKMESQIDKTEKKTYQESVNLATITCILCKTSFQNKLSLNKHMNLTHGIKQPKFRSRKDERKAIFQCFFCDKCFTRKHDMEKHVINKHPDQKDSLKSSNRAHNAEILEKCRIDDDGCMFKCDKCENKFTCSQTFLRHRKTHFSEHLNICDLCGKEFSLISRLKLHIDRVHKNLKKFKCNICEMTFKSKITQIEHMNIHTNHRPFMCDVCGKSFKQNASLAVHKLFHSDHFPFECQYCEKKFRRKSELKVHLWIHTGEKPYKCKDCAKSFRLSQNLNRHMKVHVKTICKYCGTHFQFEKFLNVHKQHCFNRSVQEGIPS